MNFGQDNLAVTESSISHIWSPGDELLAISDILKRRKFVTKVIEPYKFDSKREKALSWEN